METTRIVPPPAGLIIFGSGHRPPKIWPDVPKEESYSTSKFTKLVSFIGFHLERLKPRRVITGMALGWDQALAEACIQRQIHFDAAIPFIGQEKRWPTSSQKTYNRLLKKASEVIVVSERSNPQSFQKRNEWMVDHGDYGLVLFDGSKGGTNRCIEYAVSQNRVILNTWRSWEVWKRKGCPT